MLFLFYGFSSYSTTLPSKWDKDLILSYTESSGMVGDYCSYKFSSDTLYYKEKKNQGKEISFKTKLTQDTLNNLLLVLKTNNADKIKLEKYDYILYDGGSFSLQLRYQTNYLLNISNSAYEGLKDNDRAAFQNIINHIKKMK